MENLGTIALNGGTVYGSVNFTQGVNGNAASLDKSSFIQYANPAFATPNGSVSFWVKKNSDDYSGGIFQIGQVGQVNSIGYFYNYYNNTFVEAKSPTGWRQIYGTKAVSKSNFIHIVITWANWGSNYSSIYLYENGKYTYSQWFYDFNNSNIYLDIGKTGYYGSGNVAIDDLRFFDFALNDSQAAAEYGYSASGYNSSKHCSGTKISSGAYSCTNGKYMISETLIQECSD
jgi:hypothetical protein